MNGASTRTGPAADALSGDQMEQRDRRRKFRRYPARWKVAVVFDKADGRPTLHTNTLDLSVGGAAIVAGDGDLTGLIVTLLLARPVRPGAEPSKVIKLRAQVVSSVHVPATSGYRHGLRFVPSKDDDLGVLAGIINAAESARRSSPQAAPVPPSAPPPAPAPSAQPAAVHVPVPAPASAAPPTAARQTVAFNASPGSLLARLKEAAEAKLREEERETQAPDPKERFIPLVSGAVQKTYQHLKEVVALLDAVKPAYAKAYTLHGLPDFDDLTWASVQLDLHTRELSPTSRVFEQVALQYRLAAGKVLSVVREAPSDEKLKRVLKDAKIRFSADHERDSRGARMGTKFVMPCEVEAAVQLAGNFDTGKLTLKLRNVEHFGTAEYVLSPEAVTKEALDELVQFVLGETRRVGSLLTKGD
jgi:hypothetical protein